MKYLNPNPNLSGAYPGPQERPFSGAVPITDGQAEYLVSRNGFVIVSDTPDPEIEGSRVTLAENTEGWETWKASLPPEPEPEPTAEDVTLDMLADHEERLCMLELTTTTV